MKINVRQLFCLLILTFCLSCLKSKKQNSKSDSVIVPSKDIRATKEKIEFVSFFYNSYITALDNVPIDFKKLDSLRSLYLTESLDFSLKNANLNYDPIINAQDLPNNALENLNIKFIGDTCVVTYGGDYKTKIKLILIDKGGAFLIDKIIDEEF